MGLGDFLGSVGKVAAGAFTAGLVNPGLAPLGGIGAAKDGSGGGGNNGFTGLMMPQATPASFDALPGDPNSSALRTMLSGTKFNPMTAQSVSVDPSSYQAHDYTNENLPQYDAMRTRLNSQYSQTQGQAQDALDRQFAAAGGGPGNGAQVKQTENLAAAIAKQKGSDLEGINAQEADSRMKLNQAEKDKSFQSSEAAKSRVLQGEEFNTGAKNQASQFNAQGELTMNQFKFDANSKLAALDQAYKSSIAEFNNNEFNKQIALRQQKFTEEKTGGLFGGGGVLGLGI